MVEVEMTDRERQRRVLLTEMIDAACAHKGVSKGDFYSPCRKAHFARARHLVMWLADRLRPDLAFRIVARVMNRSDHTTIIHGIGRIERLLLAGDVQTRLSLEEICRRVGVEVPDMAAPRASRLSDAAVEERQNRAEDKKWTMQPSMNG